MFAIVWKSFDMTAELKNWVFEWIGGSARAMGENDSQSKHIMGAVGTATNSAQNAGRAGADGKGRGGVGGGATPNGLGGTPGDQGISAQEKG